MLEPLTGLEIYPHFQRRGDLWREPNSWLRRSAKERCLEVWGAGERWGWLVAPGAAARFYECG